MSRATLLPCLVLSLWLAPAAAQAEVAPDTLGTQDNGPFVGQLLRDTGSVISAPARWQGRDWKRFWLYTGITAALYASDPALRDAIQASPNGTYDALADTGNLLGDGKFQLPAMALAWLAGQQTSERLQQTSVLAFESLVVSGLITQTLKLTGHRHRPRSGDPYDTWDGPSLSSDYLSFPSGHATAAFSTATVLAMQYPEQRWLAPVVYTLAGLTAWSRVYSDAHWVSDVFVGALIGHYTAKHIVKRNARPGRQAMVIPIVNRQANGWMAGIMVVQVF